MPEKIFNLFYFTDTSVISEIGVVVHDYIKSDEESSKFLKEEVSVDYKKCNRYELPQSLHGLNDDGTLNFSSFMALSRVGRQLELFENIFIRYSASASPLCCMTPIVNGEPEIDISTDHSPFMYGNFQDHPKTGAGKMKDYLQEYMTPAGFDLPSLINNDYFSAIKLLYNNAHYVSCLKLLASFVDTIAYLAYGDERGNFVKWLDTYSDLDKIGITSAELWELRNSILHMSNLDSRKVLSGREKRISFYVAQNGYTLPEDNEIKYFNLKSLIDTIASALSIWIQTFNNNPNKFVVFIERYDTVVSDDRYAFRSM